MTLVKIYGREKAYDKHRFTKTGRIKISSRTGEKCEQKYCVQCGKKYWHGIDKYPDEECKNPKILKVLEREYR